MNKAYPVTDFVTDYPDTEVLRLNVDMELVALIGASIRVIALSSAIGVPWHSVFGYIPISLSRARQYYRRFTGGAQLGQVVVHPVDDRGPVPGSWTRGVITGSSQSRV